MVNRYAKINLKTRIIIAHAARPNEDRKRKERKISPIISAILNFVDNSVYGCKLNMERQEMNCLLKD